MKVRLEGAVLLLLCALALYRVHLLVHSPPAHQPTLLELALGLVAAVTGVCGAALAIVGPALLRPYRWPPPDRD